MQHAAQTASGYPFFEAREADVVFIRYPVRATCAAWVAYFACAAYPICAAWAVCGACAAWAAFAVCLAYHICAAYVVYAASVVC